MTTKTTLKPNYVYNGLVGITKALMMGMFHAISVTRTEETCEHATSQLRSFSKSCYMNRLQAPQCAGSSISTNWIFVCGIMQHFIWNFGYML